jgi:hypothetical protein
MLRYRNPRSEFAVVRQGFLPKRTRPYDRFPACTGKRPGIARPARPRTRRTKKAVRGAQGQAWRPTAAKHSRVWTRPPRPMRRPEPAGPDIRGARHFVWAISNAVAHRLGLERAKSTGTHHSTEGKSLHLIGREQEMFHLEKWSVMFMAAAGNKYRRRTRD